MTKFAVHILLLLGLLLASQALLVVIAFNRDTPKYVYLSATDLKHNRLRRAAAPRLILVGGSGVNLGFDGPRIQKAVNMPVVNMGLQAGLGMRFNLNEVTDALQPGDVVVIVSEYEHYYTLVNGEAIMLSYIFYNPAGLRFITSPHQALILAENWFEVTQEMVKARLSNLIAPVNTRRTAATVKKGYDAAGDYIGHLKKPSPGISNLRVGIQSEIDPEAIQVLNAFEQMSTGKGARVYLLFPTIPDELYEKYRNRISNLCNTVAAQTNIPILDAPDKYAFPREHFFDTVYHLNVQGRAVRTDKFIAALQAAWAGTPLTPCPS